MIKLYKNLTKKDFLFVILIMALTVFQVYLTMTLVDYVQGIIKAIMYVNYHNHPDELFNGLSLIVNQAGGWDNFKASIGLFGQFDSETITTLSNIADASVKDIWFNGGMMVLLAVGSMIVQAIIAMLASFVAANLSTTIRRKVYQKVEKFSLEEIDKFQTASLITRTTNDIQQIQMANLMTMRMIFQAPVTAIWALIKLQATATELTITTLIAITVLVVLIGIIMFVALPKFKIMQKLTDNLNAATRDNLTGIRIVRAYNAEEYEESKFDKANTTFTKAQLFTGNIMAIMSPMMLIIMNGLTLAIYIVGAKLINGGSTDYAAVTSYVLLGTQLVMSFVMLMMLFILWPRALVAADRINEVLESKDTILDPETEKDFTEIGTVEFKNVAFKYPDGQNNIVENLNFKIEKGKTLAIIGATSAGKSTIVNLISRLYDATSGEVLVDGVNVKDVKQSSLRSKIGFVPQKGYLFNGTIKENIAFGKKDIDMNRVETAASIACATEFISSKENTYDFKISESGKNLSGGQRQRLCIARAVYINPEILVFDDSFSALDYKTDKKLRENLKESCKDSTKIIVAQRIGTIIDADKIIVLDDGKIVGTGTHSELLKNCSLYKEIALSQLSREELGINE